MSTSQVLWLLLAFSLMLNVIAISGLIWLAKIVLQIIDYLKVQ